MLTSIARWSRNHGEEQPGNSPRNFQKHVQLNTSAGCGLACLVNEVLICGFVENHGNPMLFSLRIMAMLTEKEIPCLENLQIAYCVNCRNTNIPGYCCQRSVFCDCYRNMGHILCSVERIKSLWTPICIASPAMFPLRCANTQDHQNCCALKSHSCALATSQSNGKAWKQEAIWMKCVFCSHFDKIVYLLYNS